MDLDRDGGGAVEGAGDGGAEIDSIVTFTLVIITIPFIRTAVALGGGAVIDLNKVPVATITITQCLNIKSFKYEGDGLFICRLQLPRLKNKYLKIVN